VPQLTVFVLAGVAAVAQSGAAAGVKVSVDARALQPGELAVLTVTTGAPTGGLRVRGFGREQRPFRVDSTTWRVLLGLDLDVQPGPHVITIEPDAPLAAVTHRIVVQRKSFPTRRLTVDEAFVNPPPTVTERIEEEAKLLGRMWSSSAPMRLWTGAFVRPVPHPANSRFGSRSVLNGQPRSPHGGADFASPAGTPVKSPNTGRVVLARDLYYTGGTVVVDHGLGLLSLFAHLSRIDVVEGTAVDRGAVVGAVGATGRVTGAHLHWTLRANGARVDPLSLLAVLGSD
jgi:murein DD-endopeptidase MepM/ murein hydrolase activator NlpD